MNKLLLSVVLPAFALATLAQAQPKVENAEGGLRFVTLNSRGLDVRFVLHDLFTQANRNYVLEQIPRQDLYLNLAGVEFDESLALICKLCDLTYETQNGITTLRKSARGAGKTTSNPQTGKPEAQKPPIAPRPAPSEQSAGTVTTVSKLNTGAQSTPQKPLASGKLPVAVLRKPVTGSFIKKDLSVIVESLGKTAGVRVELDSSIPKYKLDFALGQTSLGWALNALAEKLKLQVVFTDHQTILLKKVS